MSDPKNEESETLSERWQKVVAWIQNEKYAQALPALEEMKHQVANLGLFSSNESLEDISTKSLPFLSLDYYLALCLVQDSTGDDPSAMATNRLKHVKRAIPLWQSWLEGMLEQHQDWLEQEYSNIRRDYERLAAEESSTTPQNRQDKIARFQQQKQLQQKLDYLQQLQQRRKRLNVPESESMDDYDQDGLERDLALQRLRLHILDAMEQWSMALRELPMLEMMSSKAPPPRPPPNKPLQVTHITQQPGTNTLQIQKEVIQSQVFRPGWNQPTMSLEQYADIQVQQAMEREAAQTAAEQAQQSQPQRYEQLVAKGLEDNADLVDASAKLDQQWDDWKDEHPRGSGNKRANVGDRNF